MFDFNGLRVSEIAKRLEIPWLESRKGELLLGHRLKEISREEAIKAGLLPTRRFRLVGGLTVDQDEFPPLEQIEEQLTEEVWTRGNWPSVLLSIPEAIQRVPNGVIGMYYHVPSLCVVLVAPDRSLIGIRRTSFSISYELQALNTLKRVATS